MFSFQVRELVSDCQCPTQFPMIRVAEGKYRIGDTQVLIFVRVRNTNQLFVAKLIRKRSMNVRFNASITLTAKYSIPSTTLEM